MNLPGPLVRYIYQYHRYNIFVYRDALTLQLQIPDSLVNHQVRFDRV